MERLSGAFHSKVPVYLFNKVYICSAAVCVVHFTSLFYKVIVRSLFYSLFVILKGKFEYKSIKH